MVNTAKIKGRMAELQIRQADLAKEMGISASTVCQKINNDRPMTLDEAERMSTLLGIVDAEFGAFFFAKQIA